MTASKKSDQSKRFIEAARDIGASEDADVFDRVLGKIAKAPPPKSVQKRKAVQHASDCAVHNGPAMKAGPCDCGADD